MDGDNGDTPMFAMPPTPPPERVFVPLPGSDDGRRRRWRGDDGGPAFTLLAIAVAVVLLIVALCAVGFGVGMGFGPGWWGHRHERLLACPRPPMPADSQPQFNGQQRDIRDLRRQAFRGDFFAQLELAKRYEGLRASDKNLQDTVEAAVWYALALANPQGYDRTFGRPVDRMFGPRLYSLYDDCRHAEREIGYRALDRLLSEMSTDERDKVRNRATYVLSTEGSDGFRALGRLHDFAFGPFGEPPDDGQAISARSNEGWPNAIGLFERNGVDAYMYDYLAMQSGDEGAYVLLQDLQRTAPWPGFADIAEQRARRWTPPYEFYPPEAPESGVPHSDESEPLGEADRVALYRIGDLPFRHVSEALVYLHVSGHVVDSEHDLPSHDVATLQAMLGRPATGDLSPLEKVRAIQFAAVNGSPHAQLVLAVMYAQGVGVPPDYARAFHWFEEADRQGSPEAKFAVATYFSEGLAGVADQEKAEAVVHQLDAALSGFRPSIRRLRAMLERVSPGPHRVWYGYARPEELGYPDQGQGPGYGGSQGPYAGTPTPGYGRTSPYADPSGSGYGPDAGLDPNEDWSNAAGDTSVARGAHGPERRPAPRPRAPERPRTPGPGRSAAAPAPGNERGTR